MQTLTLKIADESNLAFMLDLLHKFDFISDIKVQAKRKTSQAKTSAVAEKDNYSTHVAKLKEKYKDLPISWGEGKPDISDFAGMWQDNPRTLEQIREKAWKRKS